MRTYTEAQRAAGRKRSQQWYRANKDEVLRRSAEWGRAHPEYFRAYRRDPAKWPLLACQQMRARAKLMGIPFNLRAADLVVPALCPFTRLPFDFSINKGGIARPQSPSIDRIIPEFGYTRGNVRVISMQANIVRSNVTDPMLFKRLYDDALLWEFIR